MGWPRVGLPQVVVMILSLRYIKATSPFKSAEMQDYHVISFIQLSFAMFLCT